MKSHNTLIKPIAVFVGAVLAVAGCATTPDPGEPEVRLSTDTPVYISPASSPGEQDLFRSPVYAEAPGDAILVGYTVTVETQDGESVYEFGSETDRETLEEIDAEAASIMPERILWNGRNNSSLFVSDGTYILSVRVTDSRGRTAVSQPITVVVKNLTPEAGVDMAYNVFSPSGTGDRDVLPLHQYGNYATNWLGRIIDEDGNTVVAWNWDVTLPEEHRWDGTDENGNVVEDGTYRYVLRGSDEAGNSVTVRKDGLKVDTEQPGVALDRNRATFSPNEDGIQDTVTFTPNLPEDAELLEWSFTVTGENGKAFMDESGDSALPGSFTFAGRSNDGIFPEGEYTPRLSVTFRNGESNSAETRPVMLDVTDPVVEVESGQAEFSPEGGEDNQTITFEHTIEGAARLKGAIIPAGADDSVLTRSWDEDIPESFSWNGQTGRGDEASTGRYRYVLTATDRAGNQTTAETDAFLMDRTAPAIDLSIEPTPFYPGADARASRLRISIETDSRSEIAAREVTVYDPEGNVFARLEGAEPAEGTITWDGRNDDGDLPQSARDYTVAVTVTDSVGNESTAETAVPVGILVEEDQGGDLRFRITGIQFPPFEAEFTDVDDPDMVEASRETLDQIADLLKEYPDQDVRVEGHAVHIYHEGERMEREQEEVLLPLSEERAQAIVDALVERGVAEGRLSAAGRGGSEPLVPHEDRENRWKNRRVEFELIN